MRRQQSGWSEYLLRLDKKGKVSSAEVIGYSRSEFANAERDLKKWAFPGAKEGPYTLHLHYQWIDDDNSEVTMQYSGPTGYPPVRP